MSLCNGFKFFKGVGLICIVVVVVVLFMGCTADIFDILCGEIFYLFYNFLWGYEIKAKSVGSEFSVAKIKFGVGNRAVFGVGGGIFFVLYVIISADGSAKAWVGALTCKELCFRLSVLKKSCGVAVGKNAHVALILSFFAVRGGVDSDTTVTEGTAGVLT